MLKPSEFFTDPIQRLFANFDAKCPVTGITLEFSGGRSRGQPRFFVFAPDHLISHYRPYGDWRYSSRASSVQEAIDKALDNKKVQGWYALAWKREFDRLICD